MQKKFSLRRINPELLKWKKDDDITWLYGPFTRTTEFLNDFVPTTPLNQLTSSASLAHISTHPSDCCNHHALCIPSPEFVALDAAFVAPDTVSHGLRRNSSAELTSLSTSITTDLPSAFENKAMQAETNANMILTFPRSTLPPLNPRVPSVYPPKPAIKIKRRQKIEEFRIFSQSVQSLLAIHSKDELDRVEEAYFGASVQFSSTIRVLGEHWDSDAERKRLDNYNNACSHDFLIKPVLMGDDCIRVPFVEYSQPSLTFGEWLLNGCTKIIGILMHEDE